MDENYQSDMEAGTINCRNNVGADIINAWSRPIKLN